MHEIGGVLNNFDWIHSTNFIDRCDNNECTCCAENCIDFRFSCSHYNRLFNFVNEIRARVAFALANNGAFTISLCSINVQCIHTLNERYVYMEKE